MKVTVVQLRHEGTRLSKAEVDSALPRDGVLAFAGYRLSGDPTPQYEASLRGTDSPGAMDNIPRLYGATVRAIKGANMLISGYEVRPQQGRLRSTVSRASGCA